jgi:hypothetical protein
MKHSIIILTIFLAMSCEIITSGTIVKKWYEPEEVYQVSVDDYGWRGDEYVRIGSHYETRIDDEDFMVTIESWNSDETKKIRRSVELYEPIWNSVSLGDWIDLKALP